MIQGRIAVLYVVNISMKAVIATVLVLAIFVGVKLAISAADQPGDQVLIHRALQDSIQQSKAGRAGGVLDLLSSNLKVNDQDVSGNSRQIAQFIRERKPDLVVEDEHALVTGDEARIVSPVDLSLDLLGQSVKRRLSQVTLIFHKEDDREYLVIPTRKWKLAEVRVPQNAVADLLQ